MRFRQVSGQSLKTKSDLLVVCVSGSPGENSTFKAVNDGSDGALAKKAKREGFKGATGQRLVANTSLELVTEVMFVGTGDKAKLSLEEIRNLAAGAVRSGAARSARTVTFALPPVPSGDVAQAIQFAVEGAHLGAYRFGKYKTKAPTHKAVSTFIVLTGTNKPTGARARQFAHAVSRGAAVAEAICHARDYVNEPADFMNPSQLAKEARQIARLPGLKVRVYSAKECEKLGMGMFLAVGRGADQESKLIHLTYTPKVRAKKRVALIGKGVMFDSGGYSLKPSAGMEDMKIDMAGSAAVIASMSAIAKIGCPYEVHAVAACCENLVSGNAYKLGDVLRAMDGSTVEINNTDAEGRLTLGDAIGFTRSKIKPDEMFDFATLTGACMIALGNYTAGVMSDHEPLVADWLNAAERAGEDMWRLPLNRKLKPQLKSNIADMRNTGERWGGVLTAGLFLKHFAKDTPWVHVDIAGPASAARQSGAISRGGTGFAVATIVEYLTRD